jgi:hypothetical protein
MCSPWRVALRSTAATIAETPAPCPAACLLARRRGPRRQSWQHRAVVNGQLRMTEAIVAIFIVVCLGMILGGLPVVQR